MERDECQKNCLESILAGDQLSSFKRASGSTSLTSRQAAMLNIMPQTGCMLILRKTDLKLLIRRVARGRKPRCLSQSCRFSHYTYCEAVWTRREEDLIKGCENAMCHIEGVPAAIVPDNLKAAVTRSDRNEPVIHEDFIAFVEHTAVPSALPGYGIRGQGPG